MSQSHWRRLWRRHGRLSVNEEDTSQHVLGAAATLAVGVFGLYTLGQMFEQTRPVTERLTEDQVPFSDRKHRSGLIVAVFPKV